MSRGIACMSGGFKGVFVHGVLLALEEGGFVADAYAAASVSMLPAAYAAIRSVNTIGLEMWFENARLAGQPDVTMSQVVLRSIRKLCPPLHNALFEPSASRFLAATSLVVAEDAARIARSSGAARLGRHLLVSAARGNASWRDSNLQAYLFDTHSTDLSFRLTASIFNSVAYATTRMLHAWPEPAFVNGQQHIDASYTSLCPAVELASLGYDVAAVATEPGPIRRHIFTSATIPEEWNGKPINSIRPDGDLRDVGVDFYKATPEGLTKAFNHGIQKGRDFVQRAGPHVPVDRI